MVKTEQYDFLDFGGSKGGCIDFACRKLGGVRGCGLDIDSTKVEAMKASGYDCELADITKLSLPKNSVRFVTMSHILEHLNSLEDVALAIESATKVATDFIFIQGPYFDADVLLHENGLKFFWSDWSGHKCHFKISDLIGILRQLGLSNYAVTVRKQVVDSSDSSLHGLSSPVNQHHYDANIHPPKPIVSFSDPVFQEFQCYIKLGDIDDWQGLLRARPDSDLLFEQ